MSCREITLSELTKLNEILESLNVSTILSITQKENELVIIATPEVLQAVMFNDRFSDDFRTSLAQKLKNLVESIMNELRIKSHIELTYPSLIIHIPTCQ